MTAATTRKRKNPRKSTENAAFAASRCDKTRSCMAWRVRRADVEFFRQSEKPYSLYLVEEMVLQ